MQRRQKAEELLEAALLGMLIRFVTQMPLADQASSIAGGLEPVREIRQLLSGRLDEPLDALIRNLEAADASVPREAK